jgi:DNA uptake protein ComE-like DNA-binding protein
MKETISSLLILVLTVTQACWAGGRDIYALRPVAFGEKNEIESTIVQGVVDSSGKVDLNQNNFNSLEQELGARFLSLSPGVIKNIIAQRKSNVLFREPPDLIQIKGIGQATLESIQGQLRFLNEPLRCPVRIILSRHIDKNDTTEAV